MALKILVIDDEKNIRSSLSGILEDEGHAVDTAESGEEGVRAVRNNHYHLVFLDVMLPGMNGLEALKAIKAAAPGVFVIMMSGHANLEMAVEATRHGAYNFFEKPLVPEKILIEVEHVHSRRSIEAEVTELRKAAGWDDMIGNSPAIRELKTLLLKIAPSDSRVFIAGENGTGKELAARAIHVNSARKDRPFVKINCAAIPKDLIESELFGYEKGAFTGAVTRRIGRIEEADSGTLFLDEIGDMSLDTQAKLLRVLEENEFVRLGGNKAIGFDVRIVSATNQDLPALIDEGEFREDLYYRLRVMPVEVPPLRKRPDDIPLLVKHFAARFADRNNKPGFSFSDSAMKLLAEQQWRGNIRELKNTIERIAILADGPTITAETLRAGFLPERLPGKRDTAIPELDGKPLRDVMNDFEESIIRREYERHGGNVSKLAAELQVDRANLHRKLKQIGIK